MPSCDTLEICLVSILAARGSSKASAKSLQIKLPPLV